MHLEASGPTTLGTPDSPAQVRFHPVAEPTTILLEVTIEELPVALVAPMVVPEPAE